MTQYREIEGSHAKWVQPKTTERRFELRVGDRLVGSLAYRSKTGTLALAESARGRWTFKRVGFFNTRVTVREEGTETDLAVFRPNLWGHGALVFMDRSSFAWRSKGVWRTAWELTNAANRSIIQFRPGVQDQKRRDAFKTQATVTNERDAPSGERLHILLGFGMYMLVGHEDDDTAALAAVMG